MTKSKRNATNQKSDVSCVEILISKSYLSSSNNLAWTLTVYSLENHPVQSDRVVHGCDIFHFMSYDWKKTIKDLLEQHQIPYAVIQFFHPDSIFPDTVGAPVASPNNEQTIIAALQQLEVNDRSAAENELQESAELLR